MAQTQLKITQISKDFNLKSKEVTDGFKSIGIDKKSGASAEGDEFELFMEHLMSTHQIKDLESYLGGKNKITTVKEKKAETPAPVKEAAPAPTEKKVEQAAPAPEKAAPAPVKTAPAPEKKVEERRPEQRKAPEAQRPQQPMQDRRPDQQRQGERRDFNQGQQSQGERRDVGQRQGEKRDCSQGQQRQGDRPQ